MGNIPSRSPYPSQFITLSFDQSWLFRAWSRTSQWKNTSCHPLFVHSPPVLLCCRSYSQTRLPSIKACLFYKGTLVALESPHHLARSGLLRPDSRLWDCPRHSDVGLISGMAALLPCSRSRHLTISIVTLLSASSPCCWSPWSLPHSLAISPIALWSISSPCCWPHHLAVVNIVPNNAAYGPCPRIVNESRDKNWLV